MISGCVVPQRARKYVQHGLLVGCVLLVAGCHGPQPGNAPSGGSASSTTAATARPSAADRAYDRLDEVMNLPLPPGNYRVDVERIWVDESEEASLSALFAYTDETVDVRVGSVDPTSGFRVGLARDGFRAAVSADLKRLSEVVREESFLVTVADAPAMLQVGEVRRAAPFRVGGREYAVLIPDGEFLGTSIEVALTPAGPNMVQVTIVPAFLGISGKSGLTRLTELSTRVIAPIGTPIVLSNHDHHEDGVIETLLSRTVSSRTQRGAIVLTVTGG